MLVLSLESATETIDLNELLNTDAGAQAIAGLTGFGLPPVEAQWSSGAGDGARYRGRRILPRDIDLPLYMKAPNRAGLKAQVAKLGRVLSDEATLRLIDGTDQWTAKVVRVGGGDIVYGEDTDGELDMMIVVTLRAGEPFWTSTAQTIVTQSNTGIGPTMTVVNPGSHTAYPVWEVRGPGQDFTITSPSGEILKLKGKLGNGQIITIDTKDGTVKDASGVSQYGLLDTAPRFFALKPGSQDIALDFPTYAPTVLRTNQSQNPSLGTNAAGWSVSAMTAARTAAAFAPSGFSYKVTIDNSLPASVSVYHKRTDGTHFPVTEGLPYTFSASVARILTESSAAVNFRADIEWYNSAGTLLSTSSSPGVSTLPRYSAGWQQSDRISVTATAPTGAAKAFLKVYCTPSSGTGISFGANIHVYSVLFEQTNSVQTYFDGSTADTSSFDYAWTGTAHASTSTQSTATVDRTQARIRAIFNAREWMVI